MATVRSATGLVGGRCEQELRPLAAAARWGAADAEEVALVADRVGDDGAAAWFREWTAAGGAAWAAALFHPELPDRLMRMGLEYDRSGLPLYDLSKQICEFRLGEELARIATPVLICLPAAASPWVAQAEELHSRLPGSELTAAGPGEEPVSGWLDRFLRSDTSV